MPLYYLNFIPAGYVNHDPLFFEIQNRFTYWFDRGKMYNVMPQVTWEINKAMALSVGVNIPVSSENDYRYLLEFSVKFDHAPLSVKINVNPVTV